jgi:predicted membrane channel-forming protein YqfA (hemolysin III family)
VEAGPHQQRSGTTKDARIERDDPSTRGDAGATEGSQTPVCYDAARGIGYPRPQLRGVLHQVSFAVSLAAGPLLLTAAHGTTSKIAAGVYAASVTGMFAASALYHRIRWQDTARRRMQRLDHAMIFILIAGTYTPVFLLRMPTPYDVVGLCAVWGLALAARSGTCAGSPPRAAQSRRTSSASPYSSCTIAVIVSAAGITVDACTAGLRLSVLIGPPVF